MTYAQFIAKHGIKFTATMADSNPNMENMPAGSTHWTCTIRKGRRSMRVPFSQGPSICREPTAEDVLSCLASDASGYENARSFEDWASEYGYDTDSRQAERTYNAIKDQANGLAHVLGPDALAELFRCDPL